MSSAWVLEKLWRKKPGDGGLASSVEIHIASTLGKPATKGKELTFLPGHPCRRPHLLSTLFFDKKVVAKVKDASTLEIRQCFVHGDLHGDNIMIDDNDNRFLIDFGKTSLGHPLKMCCGLRPSSC